MRSDKTSLVIFPHPDDEFAISPLLARMAAQHRVICIYMTDGGYGGQSSVRRENESLRVLRRLGIPVEHVHFMGSANDLRDGFLHESLEKAIDALASVVPRLGKVDELYVPAWEGGHQDHDAAHLAGVALSKLLRIDRTWQFPLYHGDGLPGPWFKVLSPLESNGASMVVRLTPLERLRSILLCLSYASQWRTWVGLLPFVAWHMARNGTVALQAVDPARASASPHHGPLLYERRGFLTETEFREATAGVWQRLAGDGDSKQSAPHAA